MDLHSTSMSNLPRASKQRSIRQIIQAFEMVRDAGCLKDAPHAVGIILLGNYEQILTQCRAGDFETLKALIKLAKSRGDVALIHGYLELFLPVQATKDGGLTRPEQPINEKKARKLLIEPQLYKRLLATNIKITLEVLEQIHKRVAPVAQNWRSFLHDYLKWPRTDAPDGLGELFQDNWVKAGMLSHHGYHVGISGQPQKVRLKVLDDVLKIDLSMSPFCKAYLQEWGEPTSMSRLLKMANTIAALCRNAKRSPVNYQAAIQDWESDLAYLHDQHFVTYLNLQSATWPRT